VRFPYIGDQPVVRFCYFTQFPDVAGVIGPHLNDSYLVRFIHGEQRERYTNMVVEVTLCVGYLELARQANGYQLLGGRFPIGSGDADDGYLQLPPVVVGQFL